MIVAAAADCAEVPMPPAPKSSASIGALVVSRIRAQGWEFAGGAKIVGGAKIAGGAKLGQSRVQARD